MHSIMSTLTVTDINSATCRHLRCTQTCPYLTASRRKHLRVNGQRPGTWVALPHFTCRENLNVNFTAWLLLRMLDLTLSEAPHPHTPSILKRPPEHLLLSKTTTPQQTSSTRQTSSSNPIHSPSPTITSSKTSPPTKTSFPLPLPSFRVPTSSRTSYNRTAPTQRIPPSTSL